MRSVLLNRAVDLEKSCGRQEKGVFAAWKKHGWRGRKARRGKALTKGGRENDDGKVLICPNILFWETFTLIEKCNMLIIKYTI